MEKIRRENRKKDESKGKQEIHKKEDKTSTSEDDDNSRHSEGNVSFMTEAIVVCCFI